MSTLSKYQQPRAISKTTKKNSIIICLEITLCKIKKPQPISAVSKSAPSQESGEIHALHAVYFPAKTRITLMRIPKFNFCLKFVSRTTFFATSWNADPNSWCTKRSSFNAISNSVDIF